MHMYNGFCTQTSNDVICWFVRNETDVVVVFVFFCSPLTTSELPDDQLGIQSNWSMILNRMALNNV